MIEGFLFLRLTFNYKQLPAKHSTVFIRNTERKSVFSWQHFGCPSKMLRSMGREEMVSNHTGER